MYSIFFAYTLLSFLILAFVMVFLKRFIQLHICVFAYLSVSICMYICACECDFGDQNSVSDLLELELGEVDSHFIWVLQTELGSVEGIVSSQH